MRTPRVLADRTCSMRPPARRRSAVSCDGPTHRRGSGSDGCRRDGARRGGGAARRAVGRTGSTPAPLSPSARARGESSGGKPPDPTPSTTRPPLMSSASTVERASSAGCLKVSGDTRMPIVARWVSAANRPSSVGASSVCPYGSPMNGCRWSHSQIESTPSSSTRRQASRITVTVVCCGCSCTPTRNGAVMRRRTPCACGGTTGAGSWRRRRTRRPWPGSLRAERVPPCAGAAGRCRRVRSRSGSEGGG